MRQDDLDSPVPSRDFTRRSFIQASVGASFAAAVLPVSAQSVIDTSGHGLTAGPVTIPMGSFNLPAYRAAPQGKADGLPVVLVLSEIFGVHEHMADVTRRFAQLGYLAIAPELFVRQGDAKAITDIPRLLSEIISKVPDAQVMGDLDATVAWARGQGGDVSKLGVTGFCWGGRATWLYTAHNPAVKAGVAWYGKLVGERSALAPRQPIDLAQHLKAPVLGLYGGDDSGIPLDTVDKMKITLAAGNSPARASEIVVYPGVPHAFHADYRPSYRQQAAEDGWKRCLAWFKTHGVV